MCAFFEMLDIVCFEMMERNKIDMQRISPFYSSYNRVESLPVHWLMQFLENVLVFGCNYRATQPKRQDRGRSHNYSVYDVINQHV